MTGLSFFKTLFSAAVSVFCAVFQSQPKLVVFIFFFVLNEYLPANLHRYNQIVISFLALHYCANWKPVFLAKPYMEHVCYMVGIYTMVDVFRTSAFYYYLHRLSFNFLMRRPTCVPSSIILFLYFSLQHVGASEGMRQMGVHEVSVVEPQDKKKYCIVLVPTPTQVATTLI